MRQWPKDIARAKKVQSLLRKKVRIIPLKKTPALIAGLDAAFADNRVVAVASLFRYPELVPIEDAVASEPVDFPYASGFLSFREGRAIIKAVGKLQYKPDVVICDGQGIAHPRRMGIASHIGVLLNVVSIGCAKSRLVGEYDEPGLQKGQMSGLYYQGKRVGTVLRTRTNVRPVFVSPGHKIDIAGSARIIMDCLSEFRLPEPVRRADRLSKEMKTSGSV